MFNKPLLFILSFCITAMLLGLLFVRFTILHPVVTYTFIFLITSVLYCCISWIIFRTDLPIKYVFIGLGLAIVIRLSFISLQPIGSDDVYRYMWDGKVQSSGINPYSYPANSEQLSFLQSSLLPASVNHSDMKTLYFPFSLWFFYLCYQISGEAIWGYKLILFIGEVAALYGLFLLLAQLRIPLKNILLYALCPLAIFEFAIDCHLDGLGLPFFVFGLLFYLRKRLLISLVLLGLSMSIKPVALIILPILFLHEHGWKNRLSVLLIPIATLLLQCIPYSLHANPFEALIIYTKNWSFNGLIFETLYLYFFDNQKTRLYCAILLSIPLLFLYFSRKDFLDKIYFSILLLLLFSPVVHPWYIIWLLILLPLVRRWSGIALCATASLSSITILNYKLFGIWQQSFSILIIEYAPVIIFLIYELWKSKESATGKQSSTALSK